MLILRLSYALEYLDRVRGHCPLSAAIPLPEYPTQ